jgi:hypothetical protein
VTPAANAHGTATITVNVSDGTTTTSKTFTLTVSAVNDAPVASGSATLDAVPEGTVSPPGALLSTLFGANFSDAADGGGALAGVAITANGATSAQGTWQYSEDGSTGWTAVATTGLSNNAALVLPSTYSLRFVPAANYNGTPGSLTARLADGSQGTLSLGAGQNISAWIGTPGNWSSATVSLGTSVTAVNDAPVASGSATLAAVIEDTASPPGARVSALFGPNFSDAADGGGAIAGVAITANAATSAQGTWQYSANGSTGWTAVAESGLSDTAALALPASYWLRFVPAPDYEGAPGALTGRLADGSQGTVAAGSTQNLSGWIGTPGNWSSATVSLVTSITAENDAPTLATIGNQTIAEDASTTALAVIVGDVETAAAALTVTVSSSNSTLVPESGLALGGSGADRTLTVTPAANTNGNATITVIVSDGTTTTSKTFELTVNAVDEAPSESVIANQTIH